MAKVIDLVDDLKRLVEDSCLITNKIGELETDRDVLDNKIRILKDTIIGQIEEEQLD